MRNFFAAATIGLIILGFIIPMAWAVITGMLAIGSAPTGRREDGKKRTGGLLGGVIDDIVVASKMIDCPFCKAKIEKGVQKCKHCGEWVNA